MAKPALSRVERYRELERDVAEKLKCAADDPRVAHTATLLSLREDLQARHLSGEKIDIGDVLRISEELKVSLVPPPEPQKIVVEFIKSTDATPDGSGVCGLEACRHCGWKPASSKDFLSQCPMCTWHEGADPGRLPPRPRLPPVQIDGDAVEVVDSAPAPDNAPNAVSGRTKAIAQRPFHEVMEKDTRPIPAHSNDHAGGLCWFGTK